jgi:hypothetical protein
MRVTAENICGFIRQSLEDLKRFMPPDQHQWKSARIRHSGGLVETTKSERPNFENTLENMDVLERLSGNLNFTTILRKDTRYEGIWKKLRRASKIDVFGYYSLLPDEIMLATLNEYLWQVENLHFNEEIAKTIAKNFIMSLHRGKVSFVDFSVIRGLYLDVAEYQLPAQLLLRRIDDNEASRLFDRYRRIEEEDCLSQNFYIIERKIEFELGSEPPSIIDSNDYFEQAVKGLRILKAGQVDRQNTFRRSCFPGQIGIFPNSTYHLDKRYAPIESYHLSKDELPKLTAILKATLLGTMPNQIEIAVDRLSDSVCVR